MRDMITLRIFHFSDILRIAYILALLFNIVNIYWILLNDTCIKFRETDKEVLL